MIFIDYFLRCKTSNADKIAANIYCIIFVLSFRCGCIVILTVNQIIDRLSKRSAQIGDETYESIHSGAFNNSVALNVSTLCSMKNTRRI